jgi:hypothetical protein
MSVVEAATKQRLVKTWQNPIFNPNPFYSHALQNRDYITIGLMSDWCEQYWAGRSPTQKI